MQVRGGSLATSEGVSYLEAKHLLLLHYCSSIIFYLLLKVGVGGRERESVWVVVVVVG